MSRHIVFSPNAAKPPATYSQAVKAAGLIFVSGTAPQDATSGAIVGTTIQEQTRQCLTNISAILDAAGSSLDKIVSVTIVLADEDDFAGMNEEYLNWFPSNPPARQGRSSPFAFPGSRSPSRRSPSRERRASDVPRAFQHLPDSMIEKPITIRALTAADEPRWRELFDGYNRFYGREPDEGVTRHMLARARDPGSPVHSIVAVDDNGEVVGIANYLTHESTTQLAPVCYLQDLFVDSQQRGAGIGGRLIDWLIAEMKRQQWARLYWNTAETNYLGRMLYDKYTLHNGFLKYAIDNAPGG